MALPKVYLVPSGAQIVQGVGYELKYDVSNGWQTEPQSFLRIEHGAPLRLPP